MKLKLSLEQSFLCPQGIACSNDFLVVADTGNHQVVIFNLPVSENSAGVRIGHLGTDPNQEGFLFPASVRFIGSEQLFVADTKNKHIDCYGNTGSSWEFESSIAQFTGTSNVGYINDLVVDQDGNLLILDAQNRQILRHDLVNHATSVYLQRANWLKPTAICLGADYLWVADAGRHTVFRYDSSFNEKSVGTFGQAPGQLFEPRGLCIESDGITLIVSEGGGRRLSRFSINGDFIDITELPRGFPHEPHKLVLDQQGNLYVADAGAGRVYVFDTTIEGPIPTLDRTSIDFGSVGLGYSLPQPITLSNKGDESFQLTGVTVLGDDYTLTSSPATYPQEIQPNQAQTVEVKLSPTTTGLRSGLVKFDINSGVPSSLVADLFGEGANIEQVSVALVLDRSGSMSQSSGALSKIERLRIACRIFFDMMSARVADEITLVSFSSTAHLNVPRGTVSDQYSSLLSEVENLVSGGTTSIGAGLQIAIDQLANSPLERKVILVLTDGQENTSPFIDSVSIPSDIRVFSIGVGLPEYLNVEVLSRLATSNSGTFQITDERDYLLPKFFVNVLCDITGEQIVSDPELTFFDGQTHQYPIKLCASDISASVTLTWDHPEWHFEIFLVSPTGRTLGINEAIWRSSSRYHLALRFRLDANNVEEFQKPWLVKVRGRRYTLDPRSSQEDSGQPSSSQPRERTVLTVTVDTNHRISWAVAPPERSEETEPPPEPNITFAPSRHPTIPQVPGSSVRLQHGDKVRLIASTIAPSLGFSLTNGTVTLRQPLQSLAILTERNSDVDLDDLEEIPQSLFPYKKLGCLTLILLTIFFLALIIILVFQKAYIAALVFLILWLVITSWLFFLMRRRYKSVTLPMNIYGGNATADVDFTELDGVYEVIVKVEGEGAQGQLFQRERSLQVFVHD